MRDTVVAVSPPMPTEAACFRALESRDRRFDGMFFVAVRTTGIYCRPSCPARTPAASNVSFFRSAAAAHTAGYRACKRCIPDATPGSPDWDMQADVVGRAMRLINDGVVDRDGVSGLAQRLGYSERQLNRMLTDQLGASPIQLARSRRAFAARTLLQTTDLTAAEVAFAAGYASVRQFNDSIREAYAATPSELRDQKRGGQIAQPAGILHVRIAVRQPFAGDLLWKFLANRAVPGVESVGPGWYARTLALPHQPGAVRLRLDDSGDVRAEFELGDHRDLPPAVERVRRLLDADADPQAIADDLGSHPLMSPLVRRNPGLRVPGHVCGSEVAVRAVLGQQITVAAARTLATRLVAEVGEQVQFSWGLTRLFPAPAAIVAINPELLAMPAARKRALLGLCAALAAGDIRLDRSADRGSTLATLLAQPGIGPWTADYIAMRALGDPDVFLPTDVGVKQAWARLSSAPVAEAAAQWRPWRSYGVQHLWQSLDPDQEAELLLERRDNKGDD